METKAVEIPKSIAVALAKAQAAVKPVEKRSTNAFAKYQYASAEAVITEARAALHGAGLAFIQLGWEDEPEADALVVRYILVHAETGEIWELPPRLTPVVEGEVGKDGKFHGQPADKARAAAMTYSLAYTLRGLLLMARVAPGTDVDEREDSGGGDGHAPPTFEEALAACKTGEALRTTLWRHRQRIGEEVDRDRGGPLIAEACNRVGLTPRAAEKMIASIWGEAAPGADAPSTPNE